MSATSPARERTTVRNRHPLRRAMWPLIGVGVAVAATTYVWRVDPNLGGYPPCPLKVMTGLDCPGCGGLRCVHALSQGDIATALDQNLLAVVLLPAVIVWLGWTIVRRIKGNDTPLSALVSPRIVNGFWFTMIGVMLVYTILRNLPFVAFLPSGIG